MSEVDSALGSIPKPESILEQAERSLGLDKLSVNQKEQKVILKRFEQLLVEVESKAHEIYREYEKKALEKLVDLWVEKRREEISKALEEKNVEKVREMLLRFAELVREFESRAGQMRKARGGATFQYAVKRLLNLAGVPCEEPHEETKESLKWIDLVSPDAKTARLTPDKAVFIAVKRTLRERWKQVVPEHMKGTRLYLVTLDNELTKEKANEIKRTGMVVYVISKLKEEEHLRNKTWVRKLSDLPKDIKNNIPKPKQTKLSS